MNSNRDSELEELERKIKELTNRKKAILDKAKEEEMKKKAERKKEVEKAYDKFIELLNAYENDFGLGDGYEFSLTGNFSM